MGLKLFEIFFDKPQKVFLPGETVSGRIKVIVDSPKRIRGLEFCCKGEAHTEFSRWENVKGADGHETNQNVTFEGDEEYFKIKYYLVGGQGQEIDLPSGEHIYPFNCLLPPVLPPSFEDTNGFIRYTIKATLDRPWKFDQDTKVAFTVIAPLDLNLTPRLKETVTLNLEKYFCCLWCKSGPLNVSVSLPYSGYVPGQTINVRCDIDNASDVQVNKIFFVLSQKISFRSTRPRRETEIKNSDIVTVSHSEPIHGKQNKQFVENIIVPSLPPSNLTNCSLIDLDYELKVKVEISGFHSNLSSVIPITIGTIPIREVAGLAPSAPVGNVVIDMNKNGENANPNIGWVPPQTGHISDNPPPYSTPYGNPPPYPTSSEISADSFQNTFHPQYTKFEESQFHNPQQSDLAFKPVYPVFTFPNAPHS